MTTFSLSFGGGDTLLGLLYAAVKCTKVHFDFILSGDHHCDVTDIYLLRHRQHHVTEQSKPPLIYQDAFKGHALGFEPRPYCYLLLFRDF